MNTVQKFDSGSSTLEATVDKVITETESWIANVLERVGWSNDVLLQDKDRVTCPVNSSHVIPRESVEKHLSYCTLTSRGYSRKELDQDKSSDFFYENSNFVAQLKLDEDTIRNILNSSGVPVTGDLPQTMHRTLSELSTVQRLRIYDYCIATVKAANKAVSIPEDELLLAADSINSAEDKPKSHLEMLAMIRDMKRRRQSYRGKSTSANKKTYVELIRDLIENQTEYLKKMFEDERRETERQKRREEQQSKETHQRDRSTSHRRRRHSSNSSAKSDDEMRSTSHESRHHHHHRHHKKSKKHKKHKDDRQHKKKEKSEKEDSAPVQHESKQEQDADHS